MGFVRVSTNIESVFTFQKSRGEVISDLIRFLRCHFSRLKRLTNLVNQYFVLFLFPGEMLVLSFWQNDLWCKRTRVAGIGRYQFAAICFFGVECVVRSVGNTLSQRFPFGLMYRDYACCCDSCSPPIYVKRRIQPKPYPSQFHFDTTCVKVELSVNCILYEVAESLHLPNRPRRQHRKS